MVCFCTDELDIVMARSSGVLPSLVNLLLTGLSPEEAEQILPQLRQISVRQGTVLVEAGQPLTHVYFPTSCVLALVGTTESGATVEIALTGNEGLADVTAALGNRRSLFRLVAQLDGGAAEIGVDALVERLPRCPALHGRILAFQHQVLAQVGQSAVCNRFHTARQRLARWLLTTADKTGVRDLPLTHEFIAHMVGGPRSAVTEAASALRASGAIDYRRGIIRICNLARLRQQACECYTAVIDATRDLTAAS